MLAKLFEIKDSGSKGRGLFATKNIPIGTIIGYECKRCKKRTENDLKKLTSQELEWVREHEYKDKDGLFSDVCDKTILFLNHSCNSNILYCDKGFDIVVRDIKKGEEATYDYRILYDDLNIICSCNEINCCKLVRCVHPIPKELHKFWQKKVNRALKLIDRVEQPFQLFSYN